MCVEKNPTKYVSNSISDISVEVSLQKLTVDDNEAKFMETLWKPVTFIATMFTPNLG